MAEFLLRPPTHAELVSRAARWLKNTRRCSVVMTETGSWATEIPDAIGWDWRGRSIVVECKTSVADFYADSRKHRRLGRRCYFMTTTGLLSGKKLPDGWGLLEVAARVKVVVPAIWHWNHRAEAEVSLLVAEVRRLAVGVPRPRLTVDEVVSA